MYGGLDDTMEFFVSMASTLDIQKKQPISNACISSEDLMNAHDEAKSWRDFLKNMEQNRERSNSILE